MSEELREAVAQSTDALIVQRSRLLPRISFRMIFVVTTVAAMAAALMRQVRIGGVSSDGEPVSVGSVLGFGLLAGLSFVIALLIALSFLFLSAWLIACVSHTAPKVIESGDGKLPPQWVPPQDPVL